jgi:hypothetical protein
MRGRPVLDNHLQFSVPRQTDMKEQIGERSPPQGIEAWSALNPRFLLKLLADVAVFVVVAFAPAIPYIKQYMIIKARRDIGAFSIYVCAIVLYGQAFRILFW